MQPISMRDHFFLHYGWFFQNLGKEAVRTFMHTTVSIIELKLKILIMNKNVPLGKISTHCEIRTAQQCNCLPRPSGLK